MISRVHHIALIISDERNLWFYNLLGFKEYFRKERKYDTALLMEGHGMELEIFIDPRHPCHPMNSSEETCGLRHFALQISPDTTLEDEMERIKNSTTEVLDFGPIMNDWTGTRFVFTKDPDGTVIELRE